jgi:hypothetical protein
MPILRIAGKPNQLFKIPIINKKSMVQALAQANIQALSHSDFNAL